jgi:predicted MFS family arabinose efflux permease
MDLPAAHRRPYRWAVLAAYVPVVAMSQLLWLNFAPLLTLVQDRYKVSDLTASALVLVFPSLYLLLSIPAGALIDSRGYRFGVGAGAATMALASAIRIHDSSFWALLVGQIGIAVAQPFIVNGISKLVADWFGEEQGAIATGLGTMGMFLGMAVGLAATPPMVVALGLSMTMGVFSAIAMVSAVTFLAVVRPNDQSPPLPAEPEAGVFGRLLRNRYLVLLFVLAFLGLGEFNGLATWLQQILAPRGVSATDAGMIGGVIIVGGIFGAVVIPLISDKIRRRKPVLIICAIAALATVYPLGMGSKVRLLLVLGGVNGFFFLPAFALLLEMTSQLAGKRFAGAATSLLMLAGNAGAVGVSVVLPLLKGEPADYHGSVWLLVALLATATCLAPFLPETFSAGTNIGAGTTTVPGALS